MKIVFMGSPKFAADVLAGIVDQHQVVCVVTQPDTPAGRGHHVVFGPVKQFAMAHNIPVLQPPKINTEAQLLQKYQPDIIVTCAFGQILRQSVFDVAPIINVHGSLLPRYRGAAPVQWAVINGDQTTGVTIAQSELGLDCGPVICAMPMEISPTATAGEVLQSMVPIAVKALLQALAQIENGTATYTPQNHALATTAPMLNKNMAKIDWSRQATDLVNFVRGLNPWPVAYFYLHGEPVKIYQATALEGQAAIGSIVSCDVHHGLVIGCGHGLLRINSLQLPGKKVMSGKDFCNGRDLRAVTLE